MALADRSGGGRVDLRLVRTALGRSPGENASGVTVAHWYNTHVNQQWVTIWLVGLALFLLLVYVTQLRAVLVEAGGQRLWPNVVFASGILLMAGIIVAGSFEITLILASHNHEFAVAHFVNFYSQNNELLLLAGMDFLTFSAGLAILLNREVAPLPKLLGWYSILVAVVGIAGPLSFLAFLFGFPIWLLATGIVIAVKSRPGHARTSAGTMRASSPGRRGDGRRPDTVCGRPGGRPACGRRWPCGGLRPTAADGCLAEPPHDLDHLLPALGRVLRRPATPAARQRLDLRLGGALRARDDGAGVAHLAPGGRGDAGDVGDDGLGHLRRDELGRLLLRGAADLADHHHGLGLGVGLERRQAVDEVRAGHRVAADADAGGLADALLGQLVQRLVGERARARHDPDRPAGQGDVARGDADVALAREMMPGQFGPSRRVPGNSSARRLKTSASSWAGMPSVMQTMKAMPASAASRMASAAARGGTEMNDAVAPVSLTASATVSKTGMPSSPGPPWG